MMFSLLRDLFGHQAWADGQHWRAIEAVQSARDDETVRSRLHHIHLVQHSFMWAVGDRRAPFAMTRREDFPTFSALKEYAQRVHEDNAEQFGRLTDETLAGSISIPWFNERPLTITRAEALTQAAMHSQWHRGQNAARLRELGGTPPTVDLIVWYWLGKPAATWTD